MSQTQHDLETIHRYMSLSIELWRVKEITELLCLADKRVLNRVDVNISDCS